MVEIINNYGIGSIISRILDSAVLLGAIIVLKFLKPNQLFFMGSFIVVIHTINYNTRLIFEQKDKFQQIDLITKQFQLYQDEAIVKYPNFNLTDYQLSVNATLDGIQREILTHSTVQVMQILIYSSVISFCCQMDFVVSAIIQISVQISSCAACNIFYAYWAKNYRIKAHENYYKILVYLVMISIILCFMYFLDYLLYEIRIQRFFQQEIFLEND